MQTFRFAFTAPRLEIKRTILGRESDAVHLASKMGVVSITLWIVIIVLGRLTAYFADPIYRSMYGWRGRN